MDVSAIKNAEFSAWVKFDDDVEVLVRHISREELRDIYKKATKTRVVNRQVQEEFDSGKADGLLGQAAIVDWKGFSDGDQPFPCTPENIDLLMRRHNNFAKFINDTCTDIDYLVRQQAEAAEKN